ncbi:MAG TPA: GNAT family N-acetyltransferase [Geminicoccaceae bacterium]
MPASPAIRAARPDDLDAIRAIYAVEVLEGTASFELEPPDLAEITRRYGAIRERGLPYLVATAGGQVVGYAYAGPYRPRAAYRYSVENSVYVAGDVRRAGIGRLLLDALIDQAGAAGMRQMVAIIGDSAHLASIRLHERAGFRLVGTLTDIGFKHGRWLDTVIMQRALARERA